MTGAYTIGEYGSVTCCVTPVRGGGCLHISSMKHLGVKEEEEEEPEEGVEGEKDAAAEDAKAEE